ncbi:MAG: tyrosine-type recombinase/integrase [Desulfobulbaceae bacterium]|nr:tyrosine-type recombinase/integrase [Desulfobulbaceae bacterium]
MKKLIEQYKKERLDVAVFARSTVATYSSSIIFFCDFAEKTCHIDPINSQGKHLQAWLKVLRPTISRSRLRQHQYALKSFFAFLHKLGVIKKNPAEALPYLKKKSCKKIQPISAKEAFRLLDAVDHSNWYGKRNHLIFAILWCLGLRISELTGLQLKSFEPEHDPENRIGLLRVRGKNKKQRALFVVDSLYDEFCTYLKDPQSPKGKDKPLFPVNQDKAISNNRVQKLMKEYVRKAGIQSIVTPHILRHSFATEMYRQGVPYSAIQAMMGHERKEETALYVHIPVRLKKEALAKVAISGGDPWQ